MLTLSMSVTLRMCDFNNICRICLVQKSNMSTIYKKHILKMLRMSTKIKILKNDGLPQLICSNCCEQIRKSFDFKMLCEKSDRILHEILNNSKTPISSRSECDITDVKKTDVSEIKEESSTTPDDKQSEVSCNLKITSYKREAESNEELKISDETSDEKCASTVDNTPLKPLELNDGVKEEIKGSDENYDDERSMSDGFCSDDDVFLIDTLKAKSSQSSDGTKSEKQSITSVRVKKALNMGIDKCDPSTLTCKICNKVLVNIYSLGRHMEVHDEGREFRHICNVCEKGFYEKSQLTKHLRRHRGETRYKCELCSKAFYELSALAVHVKKHDVDPMRCDVCEKTFYVRQQLEAHSKTHNSETFRCGECSKEFRTAKYLQSHRLVHVKVRMFSCLLCDKSFKDDSALRNHHKRMHAGIPREPDVCAVCGKAVKLLARHMLRHGGERPYKCDRCPRAFVRKCDLDDHTRARHRDADSDDRRSYPYLCAACGKRCASTTQLRVHTQAHTGERPFACRLCDKRYRTNFLLTAHVRSHTEERPFVCDVCRKGFYTKHVLKCHARTHTGERPYICKICGRAFTQNSALKTHMKIH